MATLLNKVKVQIYYKFFIYGQITTEFTAFIWGRWCMHQTYCVILNLPVLYSSISRVSWATSRSWKLKSCRSMPHPLFPRSPTPTSPLVLLSVVFRDGGASSKRFGSFPLTSAPGSAVDHLRVNLLGVCTNDSQNKRQSNECLQKRRDRAAEVLANGEASNRADVSSATEDISVPKDLDLIALPQLCFPGIVALYWI